MLILAQNTKIYKIGSNFLTRSNPACNVLVGENSEITAAKSTVPETNSKSTAHRVKPSIYSTSSPSSNGNLVTDGNNGLADISNMATGSTSSIGGKKNEILVDILRQNIANNAFKPKTKVDEKNQKSERYSTKAIKFSDINIVRKSTEETSIQDYNDGELDNFSENRNFDDIQSNLLLDDVEDVSRQRRSVNNDAEMLQTGRSGSEENILLNDYTVEYEEENVGYQTTVSSYQFDDHDSNDDEHFLVVDQIEGMKVKETTSEEATNDVIIHTQIRTPIDSKLNRNYLSLAISDNITQRPLVNNQKSNREINGTKFTSTFNHRTDHNLGDSDSNSQNDSPAIIVLFDKQSTLETNNLDIDSTEVDAHEFNSKDQQDDINVNDSTNVNTNPDAIEFFSLNSNKETTEIDKQTTYSNEISIEKDVETLSGIKHLEPRYEMFDVTRNDSIKAEDVAQVLQRISVNISIGTDSGDGTQNHGIYMLHVSVPAEHYLKPTYFSSDSPQTAVHEPPIVLKPASNQLLNDNAKVTQAPKDLGYNVERDSVGMTSIARKSAELLLEYSQEISRLNSIIEYLNDTKRLENVSANKKQSSNFFTQSDDSLLVTKKDEKAENEYITETKPHYNGNDNHINSNNFGLCNQDIPPILILEGKRFAYTNLIEFT